MKYSETFKNAFRVHPEVVNLHIVAHAKTASNADEEVCADLEGLHADFYLASSSVSRQSERRIDEYRSVTEYSPRPTIILETTRPDTRQRSMIALSAKNVPTQVLLLAAYENPKSSEPLSGRKARFASRSVYYDSEASRVHLMSRDSWRWGKKPVPGEVGITMLSNYPLRLQDSDPGDRGMYFEIGPAKSFYDEEYNPHGPAAGSLKRRGLAHIVVSKENLAVKVAEQHAMSAPRESVVEPNNEIDELPEKIFLTTKQIGQTDDHFFNGIDVFFSILENNEIVEIEPLDHAMRVHWTDGPSSATHRIQSGAYDMKYEGYVITLQSGKKYHIIGDRTTIADFRQIRIPKEQADPRMSAIVESIMHNKNEGFLDHGEFMMRALDLSTPERSVRQQQIMERGDSVQTLLHKECEEYDMAVDSVKQIFNATGRIADTAWKACEPIFAFGRMLHPGVTLPHVEQLRETIEAVDVPREARKEMKREMRVQTTVPKKEVEVPRPVPQGPKASVEGLAKLQGLFGGGLNRRK